MNMNNLPLVDLKALSEPILKLIECISSGAGILYEPIREKRIAQARLYVNLLNKSADGVISELEARAIQRLIQKEAKCQVNVDEIVNRAIELMPPQLTTGLKPSDEWLADFFDLSKNASSEEMRHIWAKLLAGEVDKPGSFSRRTLHAVKLLSVDEANLFTRVCGCVWKIASNRIGHVHAVILDADEDGVYTDSYLGSEGPKAYILEALNLAQYRYFDINPDEEYSIDYYGEKFQLKSENNERIEVFVLTTIGEELYPICGHSRNDDYYQISIEHLLCKGLVQSK
jgi:hypothetical protein